MKRTTLGLGLALALAALPATAQYSNQRAPGGIDDRHAESGEEAVAAMEEARWSFGSLKVDPRLSIGDLGYVSNIYGEAPGAAENDLRANAATGLRSYLRLGDKILLTGFASLDYTWWREQDELRQLNESYGLELFGLFNRLQFVIRGGTVGIQRNLSSEVEVPVDTETERGSIDLSLDLRGPLRWFAGAQTSRTRFFGDAAGRRVGGLDLRSLDRTEDSLRGGLQYEFGSGLTIGAGVESAEASFESDPGGRSFDSVGPLFQLDYTGTRLTAELEAVARQIDFLSTGASNVNRDQVTGMVDLTYRLTERVTGAVYGTQDLNFSALDAEVIFESRRNGLSLASQITRRGRLQLFYELGEDAFSKVGVAAARRVDDHTTVGASFKFDLSDRVKVTIGYYDAQRTSTDPRFARDVTAFTASVDVGGNLLPW